MTTIAYKDFILACDSQVTYGNQKAKGSYKAIVTDDKVYAITGSVTRGLRFIEDLVSHTKPEERTKLKDTVVIEFDKKTGIMQSWESRHIALPLEQKFWADGSGGLIAMGAMEVGASAEEAVRAASKHDCYTGYRVQVFVSDKAKKMADAE